LNIKQLYEAVTAKIVAEMEAGAVPWLCPWKKTSVARFPQNAITKRRYQGINVPLLWFEAEEKGYSDHLWLTYQQAQAQGGQVRKGEKGTPVVFAKPLQVKDKETEEDRTVRMLRVFWVFNVAQMEGLSLLTAHDEPLPEHERNANAEAFLKATGADIRHGGDRAYYNLVLDHIQLPELSSFVGPDQYYSTAFHEAGHYTGHRTRLNRFSLLLPDTQEYAFEELVAELTSAYLCAHFEMKAELRHAGYLSHYLKKLKDDSTAFFKAAAAAQRAADFLLAFSETREEAA
jgi:antirestriction protein ArdC